VMSLSKATVAAADALPADALALVLAHLAGDVPSLCAAACVARAWRDAAAAPKLWARLAKLPWSSARRLTNQHLKALVKRASGCLERLDVSGASKVTDAGLAAALRLPHAVTAFFADAYCDGLTARGVAKALTSQRGRNQLLLRELSVNGLRCKPDKDIPSFDERNDDEYAWYNACKGVIQTLRTLMAPGCEVDGDTWCMPDSLQGGPCSILCGRGSTCAHCKTRAVRRSLCRRLQRMHRVP